MLIGRERAPPRDRGPHHPVTDHRTTAAMSHPRDILCAGGRGRTGLTAPADGWGRGHPRGPTGSAGTLHRLRVSSSPPAPCLRVSWVSARRCPRDRLSPARVPLGPALAVLPLGARSSQHPWRSRRGLPSERGPPVRRRDPPVPRLRPGPKVTVGGWVPAPWTRSMPLL